MKRILVRAILGRSRKILVEKGLVREVEKEMLVEKVLALDLEEDTGRGGACWLGDG